MRRKLDKTRHGSTIAFLDFLFNLVLCFVSLVILLLIQVKQNADPPRPENKNEFVILVQWDDSTNDDVDTWLMDPSKKIIGFPNKEAPGMALERDDVGRKNKTITRPDGTTEEIKVNSETINITKWQPGTYHLNLHLYRPDLKVLEQLGSQPVKVNIKIIKINPYSEVFSKDVLVERVIGGKEITVANIEIAEDGIVSKITANPIEFAMNSIHSGVGSATGFNFNAPNLQTP